MIHQRSVAIASQVGESIVQMNAKGTATTSIAVGVSIANPSKVIITEIGFSLNTFSGALTGQIRRASAPGEGIDIDGIASPLHDKLIDLPAEFLAFATTGHMVYRPKGGLFFANGRVGAREIVPGDSYEWETYSSDAGDTLLQCSFRLTATTIRGRLWMKYKAFYE